MSGAKEFSAVNQDCQTASKMKEIIRFSLVLLLICALSAGLLAVIFDIAHPRIVRQRQLEERRAIEEVLPVRPAGIEKIQQGQLVFYEAKDDTGRLIAYVFIAQAYGYSSDISAVAALRPAGDIIAVRILQQQETPGIGSRISQEDFLSQFKGKNINAGFDTIAGATISSQAVIEAIKEKALEVLNREG